MTEYRYRLNRKKSFYFKYFQVEDDLLQLIRPNPKLRSKGDFRFAKDYIFAMNDIYKMTAFHKDDFISYFLIDIFNEKLSSIISD